MRQTLTLILTIAALAGTAGAGTLFDQPLDSTLPGIYSNAGASKNADQFSIPLAASVTGATWYGHYGSTFSPPGSLEFELAFYDDVAGLPAGTASTVHTVMASVTDSGEFASGSGWSPLPVVFEFAAALPTPFAAAAGETYWLRITESDSNTSSTGPSQWLWSRADSTFGDFFAIGPPGSTTWGAFTVGGGNLAFTLTGPSSLVPLPSPAWMGLGLLGILALGRRFRR